ncbi:peptidase S15 [Alcanivorax hongdengensis A-11-3]|uniref:Peptidase S15 n=1 Tax=Alcanivorax hongdengensis A-11-3 TaxID=1177179 RepID=L0WCW6_9GAMM|nr:peptidase S15 [Alcanivorax hongdengensis A-11-3]
MIAGCSTTHLNTTNATQAPANLEARYFQVKIPTRDGKELAATVYQPAMSAGEDAPLIIATHGWGGFRAKRPFSLYGKSMLTGEAALAAWKKGYWVVFYDQRGWGDSDGHVHMMDPDYEVADLSQVIDWSLNHLPGIHRLDDGSPAIGMIGESYGAGVQTLAAFNEKRLKAIVPLASWYDMNSVAPNGEFRTGWGGILLAAGAINSGFDVGEMFAEPWRSAFGGTVNEQLKALMYQRSPAWYCDQGKRPYADALFIQGFHDTMFPYQQAEKNQQCWEKGGRDARLIGLQSAHVLPWPIQQWEGFLPFETDDNVHCGDFNDTTVDTVVSWWDEKLRGGKSELPNTCINVDDERGIALNAPLPEGRDEFPVPKSRVTLPLSGAFEWLMIGFDVGTDMFRGLWPGADLRDLKPNGGFGRPKFVPVYVARGDDELLLGKPRIDLNLGGTSGKKSMPVFVGVGVQHANHRRVKVASEQLTPLPDKGIYRMELPALSQPLEAGDRVGLIIYGFTTQFPLNSAFLARVADVQGHVWLPLSRSDNVALKDSLPYPRERSSATME